MMYTISKRIIRDLKLNLGKYLAIFILLTATIAFGSAFFIVSESVLITLDNNQQKCSVEDGNFTLTENHSFSSRRIVANHFINIENGYTLRIYKNRSSINAMTVHEGRKAEDLNEIVIDRVFAKSNHIKIGDNIKILNHTFNVVGFVSVPDYSSLFKNNTELMMNTSDFGVGFVTDNTFSDLWLTYNVVYKYSYMGPTNQVKAQLQNEGLVIVNISPKENNQAISFIEEDMGSDVPTMKALVYVVIVIIAFVFVILSSNNITEDAKSIGTLKAIGYTNNEIISHYMKLPVYITIISAIIGNALAYTVLLSPFKSLYYDTFSLPPLELELNLGALILTTIIPIIIMLLVNFFMLRGKLSQKPLNFLRNQINEVRKTRISFPKKFSFRTRFKLRVIIDNIANFITLFFGIYLASLILFFAIGITPVIDHYEETVNETFPSDYQYIVSQNVLPYEYSLNQYTMKTHYNLANQDFDLTMYGINRTDMFFRDLKLSNIEDGIVISDSLAFKLDLDVGDYLTLKDDNYSKTYTFKIVDIYEYRSSFSIFLKQKDLNNLIGYPEDYINTYLSNTKLNIDDKYIIREITKEDIASVAHQMLDSFDKLLGMIGIFSVVIYLVLMYVLTKVIIEKNSLNISLMKVFGYGSKEVKKLYISATTFAVVISLILVMPLEIITFDLLMKYAMSKVDGYVELYIPIMVYLKVISTGLIAYAVISKLHVHKINQIPMSDALKDRE